MSQLSRLICTQFEMGIILAVQNAVTLLFRENFRSLFFSYDIKVSGSLK